MVVIRLEIGVGGFSVDKNDSIAIAKALDVTGGDLKQ